MRSFIYNMLEATEQLKSKTDYSCNQLFHIISKPANVHT